MKKTRKEYNEMISNFFGIKEGDTIKIKQDYDFLEAKVIKGEDNKLYLEITGQTFSSTAHLTYFLLDEEYEIVPKPKKLGEKKCGVNGCDACPLRMLDCLIDRVGEINLYEMLDEVCDYRKISKESKVYKAFKEMLDSEKF